MRDHGLSVADVARMTHKKESTVRNWRSGQPVPTTMIELIELKIKREAQ